MRRSRSSRPARDADAVTCARRGEFGIVAPGSAAGRPGQHGPLQRASPPPRRNRRRGTEDAGWRDQLSPTSVRRVGPRSSGSSACSRVCHYAQRARGVVAAARRHHADPSRCVQHAQRGAVPSPPISTTRLLRGTALQRGARAFDAVETPPSPRPAHGRISLAHRLRQRQPGRRRPARVEQHHGRPIEWNPSSRCRAGPVCRPTLPRRPNSFHVLVERRAAPRKIGRLPLLARPRHARHPQPGPCPPRRPPGDVPRPPDALPRSAGAARPCAGGASGAASAGSMAARRCSLDALLARIHAPRYLRFLRARLGRLGGAGSGNAALDALPFGGRCAAFAPTWSPTTSRRAWACIFLRRHAADGGQLAIARAAVRSRRRRRRARWPRAKNPAPSR